MKSTYSTAFFITLFFLTGVFPPPIHIKFLFFLAINREVAPNESTQLTVAVESWRAGALAEAPSGPVSMSYSIIDVDSPIRAQTLTVVILGSQPTHADNPSLEK